MLSHRASGNTPGSDLLSHTLSHAVPSAVEGLTSVFGMGTGLSLLLRPPGKAFEKPASRGTPRTSELVVSSPDPPVHPWPRFPGSWLPGVSRRHSLSRASSRRAAEGLP